MKITILGAGAYALGLASKLNQNYKDIVIWSKVKSEIDVLKKTRTNEKAIPNFKLPSNIKFTTNLDIATKDSEIIIIAVATKYIQSVCEELKQFITNQHVVIASKGIEETSCKFASKLVIDILNTKRICTISGPSFAKDMVTKEAIGLSLAATNTTTKKVVSEAFSSSNLKIRSTNDFVGVELCGTMKNIIAIASGILDGMKASESTKAMFLTECLNDVRKLIRKFGGNEKTILSYAGFGDIILTCSSTSSRNYKYGKLLGENKSSKLLNKFLEENTVEGINTLKSIYKLVKSKKIKYPFLDLIYKVTTLKEKPEKLVSFLMEKE